MHYYLGAFYHAQSRYKDAIVEFNKALEYSPGHLPIMHALGVCLFITENFDDARVIFEELIEADSTQGRAYYFSDNKIKANEAFRIVISIATENPERDALSMATCYGWMGMEDSARYYLEICNPSNDPEESDPGTAFRLGELYLILNNQPLAYKYLHGNQKRPYI